MFVDAMSEHISGRAGLVLAVLVAMGCSSSHPEESDAAMARCEVPAPLAAAPCAAGYFAYVDPVCGPTPPDAGSMCGEGGDGLCHQECETDADCTDPCRPLCRRLGLFDGGDFNCNRVVTVCSAEDRNDC